MNALFGSTIKTYSIVEKSTSADLLILQQKQLDYEKNAAREVSNLNKTIQEKRLSDEVTRQLIMDNKKLQSLIETLTTGSTNIFSL